MGYNLGMNKNFKLHEGLFEFPDLEKISDTAIVANWDDAFHQIKKGKFLLNEDNVRSEIGDIEITVHPKDGEWPTLSHLPKVIQEIYLTALEHEKAINPDIQSMGCMISIRLQGSYKASTAKEYQDRFPKGEGDRYKAFSHFDGGGEGDLSIYCLSSTPTTVQFLGSAEVPQSQDDITRYELNRVDTTGLAQASILPGHLYRITHQTPHAEPTNLDQISDAEPRFFMRLTFAKPSKTMALSDEVYTGNSS